MKGNLALSSKFAYQPLTQLMSVFLKGSKAKAQNGTIAVESVSFIVLTLKVLNVFI